MLLKTDQDATELCWYAFRLLQITSVCGLLELIGRYFDQKVLTLGPSPCVAETTICSERFAGNRHGK